MIQVWNCPSIQLLLYVYQGYYLFDVISFCKFQFSYLKILDKSMNTLKIHSIWTIFQRVKCLFYRPFISWSWCIFVKESFIKFILLFINPLLVPFAFLIWLFIDIIIELNIPCRLSTYNISHRFIWLISVYSTGLYFFISNIWIAFSPWSKTWFIFLINIFVNCFLNSYWWQVYNILISVIKVINNRVILRSF